MPKIKQKFTKKFQNSEHFQLQNWLEFWSKDSFDHFVKNVIHLQDKTAKVFKSEVLEKTKHFTDAYFAQKAIAHHANENLPFKTLVLLGQKLNHPAYKDEVVKMINENVIKLKGVYYKLDDLDNQKKIQKAIENYQFEECKPLDTAA